MIIAALLALLAQDKLDLPERWLYCQTNLQTDANVEALDVLWRRAAKAGYTGVLLADSKLAKLADVPGNYVKNVQKVKALAAELKIKVIPAVFHVGYSNAMLWHDPNLAEGLPVKDALFVVKDGQARLESDPPVAIGPKWAWKDETLDASFTCVDPQGKNARFQQKIKVKPFRQYHASVRVRTQDFKGGETKIMALGKPSALIHSELGVKPTQAWTEHHAVFNSLESEEISLYFGTWGGKSGTIQWADPKIEEIGPLNVLRRDGTPVSLRTDDGRPLVEGKDVERIVDPLLGQKPWRGEYTVWHDVPVLRTSLPDGTRLRMSYHHAVTVHDGQVMVCPSEPKVVEMLRDEARRVHALWGAKGYMMSHDEIRVLNWDDACRGRNLDAGALLADNARTCVKILKEVNPGGEIYVWNDMFDPNHNARKDYYLVRGDLTGSWEGLDPDVTIVAWYFGKRAESFDFFTKRGHRVLAAGYYDGDPVKSAQGWIEAAKQHPGKAAGIMYTTWARNFAHIEAFAEAVDRALVK
jgi:hypothetical protein